MKRPKYKPNYYGYKIVKLISYGRATHTATVEVKDNGEWNVQLRVLDLYTQYWILKRAWKRYRKVIDGNLS